MADRPPHPRPQLRPPARPTFLRKFQDHVPNSAQLAGLLTLLVSGGILLLLAGLTLTAAVLGLIVLVPVAIITSPIWVPAGILLFVLAAGVLSLGGFAALVLGGGSWLYRYLQGCHPPGADRVDYARSRIADTAGHLREYVGGYLTHDKIQDAAPGA